MALDARPLQRADLIFLTGIDRLLFGDCAWSRADFLMADELDCGSLVIATHKRVVIGYAAYEYTADAMYVTRLTVRLHKQRKGTGSELIKLLWRWCSSPNQSRSMLACVPESFLDAQLFFQRRGFECIDIVDEPAWDFGQAGYLFQFHGRPLYLKNRIAKQMGQSYGAQHNDPSRPVGRR